MRFQRFAIFTIALALAAGALSGVAAATAKTDVMSTVTQFVNGLNTGNIKAALATCAARTSIVDEFPPHEWQGPTACSDWAHAFAAANKSQGIADGKVTVGKPWRVDVTVGRAYVVAPATYSYTQHGKRILESGSVFTVALQKTAGGWRITGWAWAAH
jgi:hypothetical protein